MLILFNKLDFVKRFPEFPGFGDRLFNEQPFTLSCLFNKHAKRIKANDSFDWIDLFNEFGGCQKNLLL